MSGKVVKKTNDKKAAGNVLPGAIVKMSEEDSLALLTQRITNILTWRLQQGNASQDYDCRKVEAKSYEMQRPSQVSFISHTAKRVARMLRRRFEREIKDVLGEDQFEFRRGKEMGDEIAMVRILKRT